MAAVRALTEAKAPLGVTDRALSVLHALLSFPSGDGAGLAGKRAPAYRTATPRRGSSSFPPTRNSPSAPMAWRGDAAASHRHAGRGRLILRRDSPNGKRFARRGQSGAIEDALASI